MLRHADGVQSGPASEIEEMTARRERGIEAAPHFHAHVLDQSVVAALAVIVGGDTIEGIPCIVKRLLRAWRDGRGR